MEREAPKVIDLMAALEASVKAAKDARKRHPSGPSEEETTKGKGAARSAARAPKQRKSA